MKYQKLVVLLILALSSCSISKLQNSGRVESSDFYSKVNFETYKSVIGFDVKLNGQTKKFLFDTGADLCLIQRDSIIGKTSKYSGASNRKASLGKEQVRSMVIGNTKFVDTYALTGNMGGLKEQIPNFGGLIGQSIIKKANWLIHYPKKELTVSNRDLIDESFTEIDITRSKGNNPYTFIEMNGVRYKVIIDFGSSSTINLPKGSKFAQAVAETIDLSENTRERYTLGGLQKITEKVGTIPHIKLGEFQFENVYVNINTSSQPRVGINFFKDFIIYIDNSNGGGFKLKKVQNNF